MKKITEFLYESNLDVLIDRLNIFVCLFITNLLYNHSQHGTGPAYGENRQTQTWPQGDVQGRYWSGKEINSVFSLPILWHRVPDWQNWSRQMCIQCSSWLLSSPYNILMVFNTILPVILSHVLLPTWKPYFCSVVKRPLVGSQLLSPEIITQKLY